MGWEFVARMLDNGLLGQFWGKPRFTVRGWCQVVVRMAVRVVEKALVHSHQSILVALFLLLFTSSGARKTDNLRRFVVTRPTNPFVYHLIETSAYCWEISGLSSVYEKKKSTKNTDSSGNSRLT